MIVDEAHTCVAADDRAHLRYRLLEKIAADPERHLVLLTATPHSGIANAFHNLLGLLDREFLKLGTAAGAARDELRARLAAHYVQRRRVDIDAWKEGGLFPTREEAEEAYVLAGEHQAFLELTLDYCTDVVEKAGSDERRQRLAFWGTLALMRCVGSSPAAALKALNTRANGAEIDIEALFDGSEEAFGSDDTEPTAPEDGDLAALIDLARRLVDRPNDDPKLAALVRRLRPLLKEGFSPIVFCRYISTAQWVGKALEKALGGMRVEIVHGEMPSDERRMRIETMDDGEQKILVATDCLSEGIDLQEIFDCGRALRPLLEPDPPPAARRARRPIRAAEVGRPRPHDLRQEQPRRRRRHRGHRPQGERDPEGDWRAGRLPRGGTRDERRPVQGDAASPARQEPRPRRPGRVRLRLDAGGQEDRGGLEKRVRTREGEPDDFRPAQPQAGRGDG